MTTNGNERGPVLLETGAATDALWGNLRRAWLTRRFFQDRDSQVGGGYAWNAERYLPAILRDEDGEPYIGFTEK